MDILYLNAKDIEQIALTDAEIIGAIEDSLRAQGNGQTSIEPRVHINPDPAYNGHFNVLRGYIAPKHVAGVKVVGDYVYNYKLGLPSELSLLNLFDPETGAPYAVIDATAITSMRTGAITSAITEMASSGFVMGLSLYTPFPSTNFKRTSTCFNSSLIIRHLQTHAYHRVFFGSIYYLLQFRHRTCF